MKRVLLFVCLCVAPFLSAQKAPKAQPLDGYAAVVNGEVITVGDVIDMIRPMLGQLSRNSRLSPKELALKQSELFEEGLEQLIENKLLVAKFGSLGAQLPPGVIEDRVDTLLRERFDGDQAKLMEMLRELGKSEEEWRDEIRNQMIAMSMRQQYVSMKVHVAPREIRDRYEEVKMEELTPLRLKLRSISFRPPAAGQSKELQERMNATLDELNAGADFEEMARKVSEGSKAEQGGDEGWVLVQRLPELIRDPLMELQPGDITDILETPTQFFIFKCEGREGGTVPTLTEMQSKLERMIRNEKEDELYEIMMEDLHREFPVQRFDAAGNLIQEKNAE